jgi:hypothetical protein
MIFCAKRIMPSSSVPGIRLMGLVTVRFTILKSGTGEQDLSLIYFTRRSVRG